MKTPEGVEKKNQKIYISGDRFAIETGDGMRMVFDLAAGTIVTVDAKEKTFTSVSLKELGAMRKRLLDQTDGLIDEALKDIPEDQRDEYKKELKERFSQSEKTHESEPSWQEYALSGESQTIAGYTSSRYTAKSSDGSRYEVWCTKEIDTTELRTFISNASKSPLMSDFGRDYSTVSLGFPMKSIRDKDGVTSSSSVTSVSFQRIPVSVFTVPNGYRNTTP